jgi:hypothetical protein
MIESEKSLKESKRERSGGIVPCEHPGTGLEEHLCVAMGIDSRGVHTGQRWRSGGTL